MTISRTRLATIAVALALAVTGLSGQSSADLFDGSVLHRIDLELNSQDWLKLKQNFQSNEFYPADVVWNGVTVRNAGVRSRGTGSRSGTKPGLRIVFGHYATDQTYLGLKSLILRNHTQDASATRENTAMWFYARLGIPAPRVSHARLYVGGQYAGLYSVVEEPDKTMLARLFGSIGDDVQNDGYLYEYNWVDEWRGSYLGSALDAYKARFSAKTHESKSDEDLYRPLETLVRLINDTPSSSFVTVVGERLDLTALVRYLAVQNFLAENDGFVGNWGINNFYLYRLENQKQHVVIAWDASEAFLDSAMAVEMRLDTNVLTRKLMEIPELRSTYFATLNEAADLAAEIPSGSTVGRLDGEIRRELALIDSAVRDDTLKPFSNNDFDQAATAMKAFAPGRITYVKCEVERLTTNPSRSCG